MSTINCEKVKKVCVKLKNMNGAKYVHAFNDDNESLDEDIDMGRGIQSVDFNNQTVSVKLRNIKLPVKTLGALLKRHEKYED